MKRLSSSWLALAGALAFGFLSPAHAAGVDANTNVTNTATVSYNGGANTASGSHAFKVDRKVLFTVAEADSSDTIVTAGAADQALAFTVTNNSNDTLDFNLSALGRGNGAIGPRGNADNFDATTVRIFIESGVAAGFQPSGPSADTQSSTLNDVPEETGGGNGTRTVYIVGNIPGGLIDGSVAVMDLQAVALRSDGTALSESGGPDGVNTIETVFADTAGTASGDIAEDNKHSAHDAFRVQSGTLLVTKSSRVISDPFSPSGQGKRIPGALIEFCIEVVASGDTTTVIMTDPVDSDLTYSAGTIRIDSPGCSDNAAGTAEDDDASDATGPNPDNGDFNVTTAGAVTVEFGNIPNGTTRRVQFRVTVK